MFPNVYSISRWYTDVYNIVKYASWQKDEYKEQCLENAKFIVKIARKDWVFLV